MRDDYGAGVRERLLGARDEEDRDAVLELEVQ
jgi:hypothetical protein